MSNTTTGTVKRVTDEEIVGGQWPKRELVLVKPDNPQFPKDESKRLLAVEFFGEKNVPKLMGVVPGQDVKVHYDVESREWEKDGAVRYFTSARGWKVEVLGGGPATSSEPTDGSDVPF